MRYTDANVGAVEVAPLLPPVQVVGMLVIQTVPLFLTEARVEAVFEVGYVFVDHPGFPELIDFIDDRAAQKFRC